MKKYLLIVLSLFCILLFIGFADTSQMGKQSSSMQSSLADLKNEVIGKTKMTLKENTCKSKWTEINIENYFDKPINLTLLASSEEYMLFSLAYEDPRKYWDAYMADMLVLYSLATDEMNVISENKKFSIAEAAISDKFIYYATSNFEDNKCFYRIHQVEIANSQNEKILIDNIYADSVFTSPNFETINKSILLRIGDKARKHSGIYQIKNDTLCKIYNPTGILDEISNEFSYNGEVFSFYEQKDGHLYIVTASADGKIDYYMPTEDRIPTQFGLDEHGLWTCERKNFGNEWECFLTYRNKKHEMWEFKLPDQLYRFRNDGKGVLTVNKGLYYLSSDGNGHFYCNKIDRSKDGTEEHSCSFFCYNIAVQKYAAQLVNKPFSISIFELEQPA